jgi:hypothetical protein
MSDPTAPELTLEKLDELEALESAVPKLVWRGCKDHPERNSNSGCWGIYDAGQHDAKVSLLSVGEQLVAMRNDLPALLATARQHLLLTAELRAWMLDKRASCVEVWCQSDRVNEALPELGEIIGEHLGYPEYDEETGELRWQPPTSKAGER